MLMNLNWADFSACPEFFPSSIVINGHEALDVRNDLKVIADEPPAILPRLLMVEPTRRRKIV